jgi:hypothetical protein
MLITRSQGGSVAVKTTVIFKPYVANAIRPRRLVKEECHEVEGGANLQYLQA